MIKNILKSFCWGLLYLAASFVGVFIALIFSIVSSANELLTMDDVAMTDFVVELIVKTAIPSLIIAAIICILVFVIYKLVKKQPFDFKRITGTKSVFFISVGLLLNVVISLILSLIYLVLPEDIGATSELESVMEMILGGDSFWVTLIGTGILVPIMEEIIFRYGIHKTLARSNLTVAYIVSALIFGLAHGNLIQGAYATVLGLIFAYVYTKTDNIWYPIIMHMSINSSSTIASTLPNALYFMGPAAIVSLIIVILLFVKSQEIKSIFSKTVDYAVSANEIYVMEENNNGSNQ